MTNRLKVMPKQPLQIVCCLVFDAQGRILLLKRHSDDLGGGLWATPGGRQETDENPEATAKREVNEETGLELDKVQYLGLHELRMPHGVAHMKTFHSRVKRRTKVTINQEEHEDYRWFKIPELLTAPDIIWGLPTTLLDFGLIDKFKGDPTLADGSKVILLELSNS